MSDRLTAAVWANPERFPRPILIEALALANRAGDDGVLALSMEALAADLRVSPRQARRVLKQLSERGELRRRPGLGRGNVTIYVLTVAETLAPPQQALPGFEPPIGRAAARQAEVAEDLKKGTSPVKGDTGAPFSPDRHHVKGDISGHDGRKAVTGVPFSGSSVTGVPFSGDGVDGRPRRRRSRKATAAPDRFAPPHPPGSINTHLELSGDGSIETGVKGGVGGKGDERAGNVPFSQPLPYDPAIEQWVRLRSVELHDPEHVASNAARAMALWRRSRLPAGDFLDLLQEARKIAQGRRVAKAANGEAGDLGLRNRMPYLFAVVEQRMGQRSEASR